MSSHVPYRGLGPTIYLFRHGQTAWSISGQHTGRTDLPLTAQGEDQVRQLATRLHGINFSHVFTSPFLRAQQSCELCDLRPAAIIEPDLAEWDYGAYEGLRTADIREARPEWNLFRDGCPEGESPTDASQRADRLIARLRRLRGEVAIFSHGHFGRVFGARWIGLPAKNGMHLLLNAPSVSILGFEHNRTEETAIVAWNIGVNRVNALNLSHAADNSLTERRNALQRWENEGGTSVAFQIPAIRRFSCKSE